MRDDAAVPVKVIGDITNRGVPAAINHGLRAARGQYLVVLDNDVVVTDSWLDQLIALANMNRGNLENGSGEDITAEDAEHAEMKTEEKTEDLYWPRRGYPLTVRESCSKFAETTGPLLARGKGFAGSKVSVFTAYCLPPTA